MFEQIKKFHLALPALLGCAVFLGVPGTSFAVSFSVTDLSVGEPGSGLATDVSGGDLTTENNIYFNDHISSSNVHDVSASAIGVPGSVNINALSKGNDVNGNQLFFSVSSSSVGEVGNAIRAQSDAGSVGGDVFSASANSDVVLAVDGADLGLAASDDLDAADAFDPVSPYLTRFTDTIYFSVDTGFSTFGTEDILFSNGAGLVTLFADGITDIGLQAGDNIDALVLNATTNIALFSLANGSTSLTGGLTGGDIFMTDLSGGFSLDISHTELGLLATDELDALDTNRIPAPGTVALLVGSLLMLRRRIRT